MAAALVGQNLGARQPGRAERAIALTVRITAWVTAFVLGGVMVFAPHIMVWFSADAQSITLGAGMLRLLAVGYLANTLALVWDSAQFGAGDTLVLMFINLIALWSVQIPLAYLLPRVANLVANGIWRSFIIGWSVQAGLMAWRCRQGKWKLRQI